MVVSETANVAIDEFLAQKRIAFIGVSRNPKDFSRMLFRELRQRGYELIPVHREAPEIEGIAAVPALDQIQPAPDAVLVMTPPQASFAIVNDCARLGIKRVWLYGAVGPGSASPEAVTACERHGIQVVAGECPFMYLKGAGFVHSLHRGIRSLFGTKLAAAR